MKIIYITAYFLSLLAEYYFLLLKDVSNISRKMRNILKAACFVNVIFSLYFIYAAIGKESITFFDWILPGIYLLLIIISASIIIALSFIKKGKQNEINAIIYDNPVTKNSFGTSGPGHAYHPWDNLTPCPKCGNDGIPYIVGKDGEDYHSGPPYRIKCLKCGYSSISSEDIDLIKSDWKQ